MGVHTSRDFHGFRLLFFYNTLAKDPDAFFGVLETMKIRIARTRHGVIISFFGTAAVLLVAALLLLHYILDPAPSPGEADRRVRLILKREFLTRERTALKERGMHLPDYDRARQWKEEIDRINGIPFLSVRVKRLIPDVLFFSTTPDFVVRVVLKEDGGNTRTRYFLLSTAGIDIETSYAAWLFSI